jgi:arylsulfatase
VTHEIAANMDLLPTFARLAGVELPPDREIDGRDIWPLLSRPGAVSPHTHFYYFAGRGPLKRPNLRGVRDRRWKLHVAEDGSAAGLFNLGEDPAEKFDRSVLFPEVVERLEKQARQFNAELSRNVRPLGGEE